MTRDRYDMPISSRYVMGRNYISILLPSFNEYRLIAQVWNNTALSTGWDSSDPSPKYSSSGSYVLGGGGIFSLCGKVNDICTSIVRSQVLFVCFSIIIALPRTYYTHFLYPITLQFPTRSLTTICICRYMVI